MPTSIKPLTGKDVFDLAQAAGIISGGFSRLSYEEAGNFGPSTDHSASDIGEACEKAAAEFNERNAT